MRRALASIDPVATLRVELDAIRQRLTALEARGRGPRDRYDGALVAEIAAAIGSRPFSAKQLMRHAAVDPDVRLRHAIQNAEIATARELGRLLARLTGCVLDGREIRQVETPRRQAQHVWFVFVHALDATRIDSPAS